MQHPQACIRRDISCGLTWTACRRSSVERDLDLQQKPKLESARRVRSLRSCIIDSMTKMHASSRRSGLCQTQSLKDSSKDTRSSLSVEAGSERMLAGPHDRAALDASWHSSLSTSTLIGIPRDAHLFASLTISPHAVFFFRSLLVTCHHDAARTERSRHRQHGRLQAHLPVRESSGPPGGITIQGLHPGYQGRCHRLKLADVSNVLG